MVGKKEKVVLVSLTIPLLAVSFVAYQQAHYLLLELDQAEEREKMLEHQLETANLLWQELENEVEELRIRLNDYDQDGLSNAFEVNVGKTDPSVPNDCYVLIFDSFGVDRWAKISLNWTHDFFTGIAEIPPENIIELFCLEATDEKLERALEQFSEEIDENDIFILSITAHGEKERDEATDRPGFLAYREGVTEPIEDGLDERIAKGVSFPYWHLDEYLDRISARGMIVMISACGSQDPQIFDALREERRVVMTQDTAHWAELLEALGYEITPEVSFRYVFLEDPGFWRELRPRDEWVKKRYGSMTEVFHAIDENGNGYISVGEALAWVHSLNIGAFELAKEEEPKTSSTNPCTLENPSFAFESYLSDYTPKELREET